MDGSGRSDGAPATSAARARALEAGGLLQLLAHACRVTGSPWAVLLEPGARTPVLASGTPPDAAALATAHRQQIPGPEAGGLTLALAPDAPAAEEAEALAGFAATLLSAGAARTGATRLREAFDVLQEGIILFDASGGLEFTNAKFREAHAFPPAALRPGTRFEEFLRAGIDAGQFPEAAGQEDSWFAARMAEHRRPEIRTELRLPGDRHVRIYVREMSDGSRIGLRVDVTDLRRSEAELSAACARAEAANRSKDAFLAMLSQEIRTPVNGVVGLADALAGRPVGAEERHLALALRETGAMLLAMIDDILDLARMDAGRFSLVEAPFAPAEALEAVAVAHAGRAETRGVALRTEYRGAATARRQGDGTRVRQILHNLVRGCG
ncbi:MAG: PAS-domain containing protein, partial [Pseudomonadota bacterium]